MIIPLKLYLNVHKSITALSSAPAKTDPVWLYIQPSRDKGLMDFA